MKAVIFSTLIVLKLIISSANVSAELESEDIVALEKVLIQAAHVNEDAEENSHYNNGMNFIQSTSDYELTAYTCYISSSLSVVGMTILFAYYGLTCTSHLSSNVQHISTNWAKRLCDGQNSCSGTVHSSTLTDPYVGCGKDFLVIAECPNGHVVTDHLSGEAQGKTFSLRCYTV